MSIFKGLRNSTKIDIDGLRYPPYDHNRILREIVMLSELGFAAADEK